MVLNGVLSVNVTTVISGISLAVVLGGIIWRLAAKVSKLETKLEGDTRSLTDKIEQKYGSLEKDLRHLIALVELRITHRQEQDAAILTRLDKLDGSIKEVEKSVWKKKDRDSLG